MKYIIKLTVFLIFITCIFYGYSKPYNVQGIKNGLDVIVIDPGHGGKDFGTSADGLKEKDLALDIGLKLGQLIKENYPDITVIYTREKDVFVPLHKRAEIANKAKADLFISIHVNYVGVQSVSGTETFFLGNHRSQENLEIAKKENSVILLEDDYSTTYQGFDPNSSESYIMFATVQNEYLEQSLQFASFIQHKFKVNAKRNDRGVKQAGFLVLRETTMPSVLIETGFISNDTEKDFISSNDGKLKLAKAIFDAFGDYKKIIEEKSSFNVNTAQTENNNKKIGTEPETPEIKPGNKPNPSAKNDIKDEIPTPKTNAEKPSVWFSVQVAVLSKQHDLKSGPFSGEKNILEIKSGGRYKYYIGKLKNYSLAESEKERLSIKFEGAFVVAFEGDKLIPLKEAIQRIKE
ncbi:MAG: N-acetylmuramoyl-L-alanine amidase [Prolixibacteraceae bacterium]|nr:N-acetylmuramoyl-L-alanine amidase [Prolixibacteraceae bacterium]MBN2773209.1 N-acetylmuramoyl-L-alanine amidase [Prolixibacteraceae bacterium]